MKKSKRPFEKHLLYFELLEALREDGCPVCVAAEKAVRKWLEFLFYEGVNAPDIRFVLRRSQGFCEIHIRDVIDIGDYLGLAIIYHDLLTSVNLRGWVERPRRAKYGPLWPCLACEHLRKTEDRLVTTLINYLDTPEVKASLEASPGLCLTHLTTAMVLGSKQSVEYLLHTHMQKIEQLIEELSEVIRKHDYRFTGEGLTKEERQAPKRAMMFLTGGRSRYREQGENSLWQEWWHRIRNGQTSYDGR